MDTQPPYDFGADSDRDECCTERWFFFPSERNLTRLGNLGSDQQELSRGDMRRVIPIDMRKDLCPPERSRRDASPDAIVPPSQRTKD